VQGSLWTPEKFMRKTSVGIALCSTLLALCVSAEAQQPKKIPRIGYLTVAGPSPSQALLQGLRDLGYVVGQNIAIEYRSADGKRDQLSDLADELVRLKVDVMSQMVQHQASRPRKPRA